MRNTKFVIIFLGIVIITYSLNELSNNKLLSPIDQIAYGHNFTPNESASFLAFVEQLQTESELVQANLANNNISLAQQHANNAAVLLTPNITREIAEQNQRVANDLIMAINDLQDITSSSSQQQQQQQSIDQLVNNIDAILGEAVTTRIEQEQRDNATILALAFADLVDSTLTNYGNAYAVDFDMTNMSNMIEMGMTGNNMDMGSIDMNSMNIGSMNMSSSEMMSSEINRNYSLVNATNYQSTQALAASVQEIFNTELKPMALNNSSALVTNLENGLTELSDSIQRKSSHMDIMMIVYAQIHPSLLEAFKLNLR